MNDILITQPKLVASFVFFFLYSSLLSSLIRPHTSFGIFDSILFLTFDFSSHVGYMFRHDSSFHVFVCLCVCVFVCLQYVFIVVMYSEEVECIITQLITRAMKRLLHLSTHMNTCTAQAIQDRGTDDDSV